MVPTSILAERELTMSTLRRKMALIGPPSAKEYDTQEENYILKRALIPAFICTYFQVKPINIFRSAVG